MKRVSSRLTGVVVALVAAIWVLAGTARLAWASTSSEMSDDGKDYGCMYRIGDYLYRIEKPSEDVLFYSYKDDKWFTSYKKQQRSYPAPYSIRTIFEHLYCDGTLCYQGGGQVYLPAVMSGDTYHDRIMSCSTTYERSHGAYNLPRISALHEIGGHRKSPDFITRIVFDEEVLGCWNHYETLRYGDRWFEGLTNLSEIIDLQYLPTDHMETMERMFADCSTLSELDLSGFETSRCWNFDGMFDGCTSLTRLTFGEGWTQEAGRLANENERATEASEEQGVSEDAQESTDEAQATSDEEMGTTSGEDSVAASDGDVLEGAESEDASTGAAPSDTVEPQSSDDGGLSASDQVADGADAPVAGDGLAPADGAGATAEDGKLVVGDDAIIVNDNLVLGPGYSYADHTLVVEETEQNAENATEAAQSELQPTANVDTTYLATFPVSMTRQEDGASFRAGEIIPDGAGTYVVADRTPMSELVVALASDDGRVWSSDDADAGIHLLSCEYAEGGAEPTVTVTDGDHTLVEGVDYTVSYADNETAGYASATICATSDAYYGQTVVPYLVSDVCAYALLYQDGLLYLKQGHERPSPAIVSMTKPLAASMRWFAPEDEDAGSWVPWKDVADQVKRVMVDESFANMQPQSMAGWFAGCTSLTELDLSGIDASCVRDVSGLARGCSRLERLVLGDTRMPAVTSSAGWIDGCNALKEIVTGRYWCNTKEAVGALTLPKESYCISPSYALVKAGTKLPYGAGTWRLRDLSMASATKVVTKTSTYTCTGKAITPSFTVKMGDITLRKGIDYTVEYKYNVNPGNAKAILRGKGVMSGGLEVPFRIVARVVKVGDRLVYTDNNATYTYQVTNVSASGTAANVELLRVVVRRPALTSLALPSQCTIGGVRLSVTSVSSKLTGSFRKVSKVIVGARVTRIGARAFSRTKTVRTLVIKSARLTSVTNCLAGSRITRVQTKVRLSQTKRNKYKTWFTRKAGKSGIRYTYG